MRDMIRRMGWTAGPALLSLAQAYAQIPPSEAVQADSIVLVRSRCYGTCPAYRLRLSATGDVLFQSRNPDDEGRAHSDTLPAEGFAFLVARAERIGFFDLPDRIDEGNQAWCPVYATDHPTYIGAIYDPKGRKSVVYYSGCYGGEGDTALRESLGRLKQFFAAVDSVAGSSRWVRPAPFR